MAINNVEKTVRDYVQEYSRDPEFIAEKLAIKIIEELIECLERKNLNRASLAKKMDVSKAHISRILNAPPNMTLLTIAKMAVALGVTPDVCLNAESDSMTLRTPMAATEMYLDAFETDAGIYTFPMGTQQIGYWATTEASPMNFTGSVVHAGTAILTSDVAENRETVYAGGSV